MGEIIITANGYKSDDVNAIISDVMTLGDYYSKNGVTISEGLSKSFRTDSYECLLVTTLLVTIVGNVASDLIMRLVDKLNKNRKPNINIQINIENNYFNLPNEEEDLKKFIDR